MRPSTRARRNTSTTQPLQILQPITTRRGTLVGRISKPRPPSSTTIRTKQSPKLPKPRKSLIQPSKPTKASTLLSEPPLPSSPLSHYSAPLHTPPPTHHTTHLALSFLPTGPPVAREQHFNHISSLLDAALHHENPATSLYVCGTPGTGKTLTVSNVLRSLQTKQIPETAVIDLVSDDDDEQQEQDQMQKPPPPTHSTNHIWVNCAHLSAPRDLFVEVATKLNLPQTASADAAKAAIRTFAQTAGPRMVVVLDEVDFLTSRDQLVLYAAFEWPYLQASRLVLVGIANAIDLPVRLLPWLRANRCMPSIVQFAPYNSEALRAIVRQRVQEGTHAGLTDVAVSLAAKKVAAGNGDARLVLDVCREAEAVLRREGNAARNAISVVSTILNQRGALSAAVETIRQLPVQQQLALCVAANAVLFGDLKTVSKLEGKKTLNRKATIAGLYESFSRMCARTRVPGVSFPEFADICSNALVHHGLLEVAGGRGRGKGSAKTIRSKAVRLRVPIEDVRAGVAEKGFLSLLIAH